MSVMVKCLLALLVRVCVCVAVLSLWPPAEAQTDKGSKWIYIGGTGQDQGFSYDPETIMEISHDVVTVWTRMIGRDSSEYKILREINCTHKIIRNDQVITERQRGLAPAQIFDRAWRGVTRGTPEGELFAVLCRKPAPESFNKQQDPLKYPHK